MSMAPAQFYGSYVPKRLEAARTFIAAMVELGQDRSSGSARRILDRRRAESPPLYGGRA
jgi:hypothetical protein